MAAPAKGGSPRAARMLPPVLLYSQVSTTAPDKRLTTKATTPNRLIPG